MSPRVCYVVLKLNQCYKLEIIQAYATIFQQSGEDNKNFNDEVARAMSILPACFTIMAVDFDATLGKKQNEKEIALGSHGMGEIN